MLPELANAVSIGENALQVCLCMCMCVCVCVCSSLYDEIKHVVRNEAAPHGGGMLPSIVCLHLLMQMKPKTVPGIRSHSCDYLVNSLHPSWVFNLRDYVQGYWL